VALVQENNVWLTAHLAVNPNQWGWDEGDKGALCLNVSHSSIYLSIPFSIHLYLEDSFQLETPRLFRLQFRSCSPP
jgi:hypothetical protein